MYINVKKKIGLTREENKLHAPNNLWPLRIRHILEQLL